MSLQMKTMNGVQSYFAKYNNSKNTSSSWARICWWQKKKHRKSSVILRKCVYKKAKQCKRVSLKGVHKNTYTHTQTRKHTRTHTHTNREKHTYTLKHYAHNTNHTSATPWLGLGVALLWRWFLQYPRRPRRVGTSRAPVFLSRACCESRYFHLLREILLPYSPALWAQRRFFSPNTTTLSGESFITTWFNATCRLGESMTNQSTSQPPKSDSAAQKMQTPVSMAERELTYGLATVGILDTGSCSGMHRSQTLSEREVSPCMQQRSLFDMCTSQISLHHSRRSQ